MDQYASDNALSTGSVPDSPEPAEGAAGAPADINVFNREELFERLGDDEELVAEIVEIFLDDAPKQIAAIEAAVAAGDGTTIRDRAHALKGASANMGAAELRGKAEQMEMAGRDGRLDETAGLLDGIRESFARLREVLARL